MAMFQGVDEVAAQPRTGLDGRPRNRTWWWVALTAFAAVGLGALTWWCVTYGWPNHQIRQDSATVRAVELPDVFEPAPLACAGPGLLCAWTDLDPGQAAPAVHAALAEAGVELPDARCGVGTSVPFHGYDFTVPATAQGVCYTQAGRHGVVLGLLARDEVPIGDRDGEPVPLPRTLVTVGWHYDTLSRTVPGSPTLEGREPWLEAAELEALPAPLSDLACDDLGGPVCHTAELTIWDDVPRAETFWRLAEQLLAGGVIVDKVGCDESDGCSMDGVIARPAHPGQSLRFWLTTSSDQTPDRVSLSLWPWN